MRISDWSSDVCSSDLVARDHPDTVAVLLAELQETGLAAVVSYGGWADDPPVRVLHDMLERGRADEPGGSSQEEGLTHGSGPPEPWRWPPHKSWPSWLRA